MAVVTVERDVAAPPEKVWAIVTDLDAMTETISAITAFERTGGDPGFGVGTAWKETRVMFGREATEQIEVTALDEGRSYTVESISRGVLYRSVMRVEPAGEGSAVSWEFGSEAKTTSAKLMSAVGKLFEGQTKKALMQDLDDIADAAEREG